MSSIADSLGIKGIFRIQIVEDGPDGEVQVVGDSGWHENQITNLGFNQYLVGSLGDVGSSKQITHMALGSGGVPGAADTTLAGEVEVRQSVTKATSSSSKTLRLTATFASANSFVTNTQSISNVGLFHTSTKGAATLFAGNTYASSAVATNQNVNATYDIIFS